MRLSWLPICFVALLACETSNSDPTGPGGAGGTNAGPGGAGGSGAGGSGAGGTGAGGGCQGCGPDAFCDYSYHWCGPPSDTGAEDIPTCTDEPTSCPTVYEPVCGCDGQVYDSECEAHSQGVDTGAETCEPQATPVDLFPCGFRYCDPATSYCLHEEGDTGDRDFSCTPLPSACDPSAPDCSCLTLDELQTCSVVTGNAVSGLSVLQILQ